ncbi:MAG TPA: aconitate hydratase AcnA [Gammaproteobacteria bacterium]|nr:aconitate hydratase AcnA [Gammaproteobacteria bacterium]
MLDSFAARRSIRVGDVDYRIHRLDAVGGGVDALPYTLKILLENLLRHEDGANITADDIRALASWDPKAEPDREIAFTPARVILQDFTGVPAVVDLAAMRDAVVRLGGKAASINPLSPVELVIDHSVQVDRFGTPTALAENNAIEFERNRERYAFLRWGQNAFDNFRVVPPNTGIVHQVNLEYLSRVVFDVERDGERVAYPDTLVGTDSHTTMINGLGILGWGVGGIEAEAAMLGQPITMLIPQVIGFELTGRLPEGATGTDLVLTVTEMLRAHGVVGKFVEFFGEGLDHLPLADRATIGNMSPEYGSTCAVFPIDNETLRYLELSGRDRKVIQLVERYAKEQGLWRTSSKARYTHVLSLDLGAVEPSISGPRRPQERIPLRSAAEKAASLLAKANDVPPTRVPVELDGKTFVLEDGAVTIAAITSCTNTSNPAVMIGAGLLARNAAARGLKPKPWVKTSLAPGSKVVTDYFEKCGLLDDLDALKFNLVGYGCTTCIAAGTPVLLANGTARPIEALPSAGGVRLFGPTADRRLAMARQREMISQGERDCVSLVLQDGRRLTCTPDHEILSADGRWVRADRLVVGKDRVAMGLEAPLDEIGVDEAGYSLGAGSLALTMDGAQERAKTLAFARLVGHLLSDGSISVAEQGRMNVGQALDREAVLDDIELLTAKRPVGSRYDDRKWSIVLPKELTRAVIALPGVRVGKRIGQAPTLPEFVLDPACPTAVVREFLGGLFGADGHGPMLHRWGESEDEASLEPPAYSQSARPEHAEDTKRMMQQLIGLLVRCGVKAKGAKIYEHPTRQAASSYPAAGDGTPRVEVRLDLPEGLSFVERVGFRYCIDKSMRASAAAVYWRTIDTINQQRLWMADRLDELRRVDTERSFSATRALAAAELAERETPVFPHYSLLEGHDRFDRLPSAEARSFRPLHRQSCDFPSPAALFEQLGVRDWFAALEPRDERGQPKRYCAEKESLTLPTFALAVIDRRDAGKREVYDLAVDDLQAFVAGTVAVHNCIGNSGPLPEPIAAAIQGSDLVACSVLSGNRNFEGRIHPLVKMNFLASPPLVVAYALAGNMKTDLYKDPLGTDQAGKPVYLRDIWPSSREINDLIRANVTSAMFKSSYSDVFAGDENWNSLEVPGGATYAWDADSTYVQHPPYFESMQREPKPPRDIEGARVLALLGDMVTTDHISPAGSIALNSPAGAYLLSLGVEQKDFNSYGSRRGNHEVMMRGTFANVRLRNQLAPGTEGGWTTYLPSGEKTSIYEAAMRYKADGTPLLILAGKEYGAGSSRDWAAKGTALLGVKAVLAESFERIHRSNLIGMGVLPLQFKDGDTAESLGLNGTEVFDIRGLRPERVKEVDVTATRPDGKKKQFKARVRIDTPKEQDYFNHGGILHYVLRQLAAQ